jgi:MFS family permease
MTGGLETYFSAFAIFLKASASQVALIATLPNLLGSLAQLLSAWIGHRIQQRKPIIVFSAFLQAMLLPLIFLLPVLFPDHAVLLLMLGLTLYYVASHMIEPQWISLMGDLVPERKRGRYFGHRTRLASIASCSALAVSGLVLHVLDINDLPLIGFAILFLIAFLARLISVRNLHKMHEPRPHAISLESSTDLRWLRKPEFSAAKRFSAYFILMQMAVGIAAPFFAVYMLKTLQFSYLQFMFNTGTAILFQFLTLAYWGRIGDVMGNRLVLLVTGMLIPLLPGLWIVSPNQWYLLSLQVLAGVAWAGFNLSSGNMLYELVPREKRATYQALQNVVLTFSVFVGGLIGVLIVNAMPQTLSFNNWEFTITTTLFWAFIMSSLMRGAVAAIFLPRLRELRKPRRQVTPYVLVYRVTRLNAFMGLFFDVVTRIKKRDGRSPGS